MKRFSKRSTGVRVRETAMHSVKCSECGRDCEVPFKPTGSKPVYCRDCFEKKEGGKPKRYNDRSRRDRDRGSYDERSMYSATCDNCGDRCKVPFKPTSGKSVYCSKCFEDIEKGRSTVPEGNNNAEMMEKLDMLNDKVNQIIRLLVPSKSKKSTLSSLKKPIEGSGKSKAVSKSAQKPKKKMLPS